MQRFSAPFPTVLLPTEVIEEVIDQASDDRLTLRRLTLLCKSLLTRARFHLFTAIIIRSVEQMNSSSEFFDSHPWVLPLVQKVILSGNIPDGYSTPHIPLLDMIRVHLFTRLPNLHAWEMTTDGLREPEPRLSIHPSTRLCYWTHGGRIQHLELVHIRIQGVSHFARLISAFISLQNLICSEIELPYPEEDQTSLHASQLNPNFKLSKPLTIRHLSVAMSVDIRLVEYLLSSSLATLASLSICLDSRQGEGVKYGQVETYFRRLEESLSRLSELSLLTLVISGTYYGEEHNKPESPVERMRWATRMLKHARKLSPLRDVQVEFNMHSIGDLGGALYGGLPPQSEACSELEEVLLTFPSSNLRICLRRPEGRRAGRPEFWSPTITSAFPKLNERGLLLLPYTRPSLDPLGHERSVTCLVPFKDNNRMATASSDGTIIIWDMELGIVEWQWFAHRDSVYALGVSPNNQRVVSAGGYCGESLVIWDISDDVSKITVLASIDSDQEKYDKTAIIACAWSPDGTLIASGCRDGTIHIWDALTFQQRGLLPIDDRPEHRPYFPELLQWSADSQYLAWRYSIGSGRTELFLDKWTIWSPLREEPPKRFSSHEFSGIHPTNFSAFRFDPRSKYAVAIIKYCDSEDLVVNDGPAKDALGEDGSSNELRLEYPHVRDVVTGAMVANLEHPRVIGVHFSPDGRSLFSISRDNSVKIWNVDDWHETASLEIHGEGMMEVVCFSPSGEYVATAYMPAVVNVDGTIPVTLRLWRLGQAPQCVAEFREHNHWGKHLEFSPDGKFLVCGDESGIVHIHRLSSSIGH